MAIEFLSESAVLEDRLASLEDPSLAERLAREHPELFPEAPPELPRTQRQVLAWATRRVGTAVIAVTAAFSIVAGYFGSESLRHPALAPVTPAAQGTATAALPLAKPAARRQAAKPAAHRAAPVAHHAAPVAHHAAPVAYHAPAVVHHAAPVVQYVPVAHPRPDRQAQLLRARLHAQDAEIARLREQAAAEHAAAQTARAQARAHQRTATAPASAPQSRPQTDPAAGSATATQSATSPNTRTEPGTGTATGTPVDAPLPNSGTRTPPTNTGGGGWSEHPSGGTMGGFPPIPVGVPRDPCTPRGGRTGAVLQAVQAVQIIQSLSRQH